MKKALLTFILFAEAFSLQAQSYAPQPGEISFRVIQSTNHYAHKTVLTTPFSKEFTPSMKYIDLDSATPSHEYMGLGISMTDASCWLLSKLGKKNADRLLKDAFTPQGLNLSLVRLNCGASDYSTALYNYNPIPEDVKMQHFSVARDEQYMIPVIKRALKMNKEMFVFSSLWSPPGWMKDSGNMCGGCLLDEYMPAFANYWAAYLNAYGERGIHIDAITIQNEPETDQNGANPATLVSTEQEIALAGTLLPEAFRNNGIDTEIWILDHNYDCYERVVKELSNPEVRANVAAVAWHPYNGEPEMVGRVREMFPEIKMHLTERGLNLRDRDIQNEKWCADMVFGALNNGCSSFSAWNLALDEDGQPLTGKFYCRGLYEINLEKGTFSTTPLYNLFSHIGPYVQRGAQIMAAEQQHKDLATITFRNPDGGYVIVVACDNMEGKRRRLQVKYKDQYLVLSLPLYSWSISTILIDRI